MYVCGPNDIKICYCIPLLGLVNFIFMFISKNYCAKIIMVVLDFINSASEQLAKIISFLKISLCDLCRRFLQQPSSMW